MNLLNAWKSFFVLEEQMLEVDCTSLTPENVLKVLLVLDSYDIIGRVFCHYLL